MGYDLTRGLSGTERCSFLNAARGKVFTKSTGGVVLASDHDQDQKSVILMPGVHSLDISSLVNLVTLLTRVIQHEW